MFDMIRRISTRQLVLTQLPTFAASLAIAEAFYRWDGFVLRCLAFLVTWYTIDWVVHSTVRAVAAIREEDLHQVKRHSSSPPKASSLYIEDTAVEAP